MSEDLRALADELDAAFARADVPARLRLLRDALTGRIVFTTSFGIEDQALTARHPVAGSRHRSLHARHRPDVPGDL